MRLLDLFSGVGGFSLGTERAGWETVAFCEFDPMCQRVLAKHWPRVPIYDDVRTLTYDRLKSDGITTIDAISGGFPCQDLSTAGHQRGITAARSGLWSEYARIIDEVQPLVVLVENVTALLSGGDGAWMGRLLGDLAALGYDAEWHCIPAAALGAYHRRDRVWIIAYPNGLGLQEDQQQSGAPGTPIVTVREFSGHACTAPQPQWQDPSRDSRTGYGVPHCMDRIKMMGNAVVPAIPEILATLVSHKLRKGEL